LKNGPRQERGRDVRRHDGIVFPRGTRRLTGSRMTLTCTRTCTLRSQQTHASGGVDARGWNDRKWKDISLDVTPRNRRRPRDPFPPIAPSIHSGRDETPRYTRQDRVWYSPLVDHPSDDRTPQRYWLLLTRQDLFSSQIIGIQTSKSM